MKKLNIYLVVLAALVLIIHTGCQEKIDIDLNSKDPALVVDGLVRSGVGPHLVQLSLSGSYFTDGEQPERASGALVTVTDSDGTVDTLVEPVAGYYIATGTNGQVGHTYTLTIVYQGETYTATTFMAPVPPIDSLTYQYEEENLFYDAGYYVRLHTQEPSQLGNYYRFLYNIYSFNGFQMHEIAGSVASDEWINGNYISYDFNHDYTHEIGDTVVIEVLSIDQGAYEFYTALFNQSSTGDLFDTPPGNIQGNINNGAFGYFSASASVKDTIVILP